MIDHCTMKLFRCSLALTQLKIQDTVWTMGDCLQRRCQKHSRFLQLIDRLPVRCRWAGFHHQERSFSDTSHQIMLHSCICCRQPLFFFMPSRIIIPGYNIYIFPELFIIQSVIIIHQIRRHRDFRSSLPESCYFRLHEIDCLFRHKPLPVQL